LHLSPTCRENKRNENKRNENKKDVYPVLAAVHWILSVSMESRGIENVSTTMVANFVTKLFATTFKERLRTKELLISRV
jgi:hypothetical protein